MGSRQSLDNGIPYLHYTPEELMEGLADVIHCVRLESHLRSRCDDTEINGADSSSEDSGTDCNRWCELPRQMAETNDNVRSLGICIVKSIMPFVGRTSP
jgi:hypothetical protein